MSKGSECGRDMWNLRRKHGRDKKHMRLHIMTHEDKDSKEEEGSLFLVM